MHASINSSHFYADTSLSRYQRLNSDEVQAFLLAYFTTSGGEIYSGVEW